MSNQQEGNSISNQNNANTFRTNPSRMDINQILNPQVVNNIPNQYNANTGRTDPSRMSINHILNQPRVSVEGSSHRNAEGPPIQQGQGHMQNEQPEGRYQKCDEQGNPSYGDSSSQLLPEHGFVDYGPGSKSGGQVVSHNWGARYLGLHLPAVESGTALTNFEATSRDYPIRHGAVGPRQNHLWKDMSATEEAGEFRTGLPCPICRKLLRDAQCVRAHVGSIHGEQYLESHTWTSDNLLTRPGR